MRRALLLLFLALLSCPPAMAQDQVNVVFLNSDPVVAVHSNFRGQTVTLFGNIEPVEPGQDGPYSVIVLVQGPSADWVVRQKARQAGLVLNSASSLRRTPSNGIASASMPSPHSPGRLTIPRTSMPNLSA